jgi:hypothetical protein
LTTNEQKNQQRIFMVLLFVLTFAYIRLQVSLLFCLHQSSIETPMVIIRTTEKEKKYYCDFFFIMHAIHIVAMDEVLFGFIKYAA